MKTLPKCAGLLLIHANIAPPQVKVEEHAAAAAFRTRTYQHMHNLGQQNAEPCLPWSPGRNNHASPASVGPVREVSLGSFQESRMPSKIFQDINNITKLPVPKRNPGPVLDCSSC